MESFVGGPTVFEEVDDLATGFVVDEDKEKPVETAVAASGSYTPIRIFDF